jgi:hypothetical protein
MINTVQLDFANLAAAEGFFCSVEEANSRISFSESDKGSSELDYKHIQNVPQCLELLINDHCGDHGRAREAIWLSMPPHVKRVAEEALSKGFDRMPGEVIAEFRRQVHVGNIHWSPGDAKKIRYRTTSNEANRHAADGNRTKQTIESHHRLQTAFPGCFAEEIGIGTVRSGISFWMREELGIWRIGFWSGRQYRLTSAASPIQIVAGLFGGAWLPFGKTPTGLADCVVRDNGLQEIEEYDLEASPELNTGETETNPRHLGLTRDEIRLSLADILCCHHSRCKDAIWVCNNVESAIVVCDFSGHNLAAGKISVFIDVCNKDRSCDLVWIVARRLKAVVRDSIGELVPAP